MLSAKPFHDSISLVTTSSFGNRLTLLLYTCLPIYLCSLRIYFSKPMRNTLLEKGLVKKNRTPLTQGVVTGFHLVNSIEGFGLYLRATMPATTTNIANPILNLLCNA